MYTKMPPFENVVKAHLELKMIELMRKQGFSHYIRNLISCSNMKSLECTAIKPFPNKMTIILYMLSLFMEQ